MVNPISPNDISLEQIGALPPELQSLATGSRHHVPISSTQAAICLEHSYRVAIVVNNQVVFSDNCFLPPRTKSLLSLKKFSVYVQQLLCFYLIQYFFRLSLTFWCLNARFWLRCLLAKS